MRIECSTRTPAFVIFMASALVISGSVVARRPQASAIVHEAQQSGPPSSSLANSTDQLAKLEVLALDKNDHPVADMKPQDLRLTQSKHEVKITSVQFDASDALTFAFLFDLSGSRREDSRFRSEFAAASGFLRRIWRSGDAASIVAFNDHSYRMTASSQDLEAIVHGVDSLARFVPTGFTALNDTICSVASDQVSASFGRRVFLIFSDFGDNHSRHSEQEAIECAWKGDVKIYSILFKEEYYPTPEERMGWESAKAFSDQTGGLAFAPKSAAETSECLTLLSQLMRSGYVVVYTLPFAKSSKNPASIDMKTTRRGVNLYFARGYYEQ